MGWLSKVLIERPPRSFDSIKAGILGPTLSPDEVDGCNAIIAAMGAAPLAHAAYALATAYHETASTMQPVKEYGGPSYFARMYDVTGARPKMALAHGNTAPGDGARYFGRGYVQLTWKCNYKKAGDKLGLDLCGDPDLALGPIVAAKIMRQGMDAGWFTGKRFSSYLPGSGAATRQQFGDARRIINGTDKAAKIAAHALAFQAALEAGGWA